MKRAIPLLLLIFAYEAAAGAIMPAHKTVEHAVAVKPGAGYLGSSVPVGGPISLVLKPKGTSVAVNFVSQNGVYASRFTERARPAVADAPIGIGSVVYGNNDNDLVGEVVNLFDSKAEIRWGLLNGAAYSGDLSYWDLSGLSQVSESGSLKKGAVVYGNNGNDLVGAVRRVFKNGIAEIEWRFKNGEYYSGNLSYWNESGLSETVSESGSLKKGAVVYGNNDHDLVGIVQRVFNNGKIEIKWNLYDGVLYQGKLSYWEASHLSVQTGCAHDLCPGDRVYGNNGHDLVGIVQRIFDNGKVEIKWNLYDGEFYQGDLSYWEADHLQRGAPTR